VLNQYFTVKGDTFSEKDSIRRSFLKPTKIFDLKKEVLTFNHTLLKGNIILHSDTTLIIDSTTRMENALVFAKTIVIKSGFTGNCQLFATDSISVGRNCRFEYPSCLGVIRYNKTKSKSQARVSIGENSIISGLIFSYDGNPDNLKPLINIGKKDTIRGQVYTQGILQLNDKAVVDGSVFTCSFSYKSAFTLYENYLINITLDSRGLSPYYLSSEVAPVATKKKKVLQWLEGN
jgi:cytoskeletal protein CcmA (bactofilin family)